MAGVSEDDQIGVGIIVVEAVCARGAADQMAIHNSATKTIHRFMVTSISWARDRELAMRSVMKAWGWLSAQAHQSLLMPLSVTEEAAIRPARHRRRVFVGVIIARLRGCCNRLRQKRPGCRGLKIPASRH